MGRVEVASECGCGWRWRGEGIRSVDVVLVVGNGNGSGDGRVLELVGVTAGMVVIGAVVGAGAAGYDGVCIVE